MIELIEAILADRDDPAPYRVFGDWLEGRGDPHGELIALQLRNAETNLEDGALLLQEKTHLQRNPSLTPALDQWRARYIWKWGFIDAVELDNPAPENLVTALQHPSCALVRRLQLELDPSSVRDVLDGFAQQTQTIELLRLYAPTDVVATMASDAFWARVSRLQWLDIEGTSLFERVALPQLGSLKIEGVPFRSDGVWELPGLQTLTWEEPGSVQSMAPLWSSALPALTALSVYGVVDSDYANEHFFAAIARLRELTIPAHAFGGTPRDALATLTEHAPRFVHLERFDVHWQFNAEEDEDEDEALALQELRSELRAALPQCDLDAND